MKYRDFGIVLITILTGFLIYLPFEAYKKHGFDGVIIWACTIVGMYCIWAVCYAIDEEEKKKLSSQQKHNNKPNSEPDK